MSKLIYISYNDQIINHHLQHIQPHYFFIYISYNDQIINAKFKELIKFSTSIYISYNDQIINIYSYYTSQFDLLFTFHIMIRL